MRATGRLVTLGLVGAALVAGCGPGESSPPAALRAAGTAPAAVATPPATPSTGRYVALGSSFAAGTGIGPDMGGGCGRSARNYPHLLADRLGLDLVDATCGGATTANLSSAPQRGHPPQIDVLTADARLVTVTVGGNDLRYSAATVVCANAAAADRPCTSLPSPEETARAAVTLRTDLVRLFGEIRSKAPNARMLLVTYPRVFPDPAATCAGNVISTGDSGTLAAMGAILQETFRLVAADTGVLLVDTYSASTGHDVCAPAADRWVEGSDATGLRYHPNAAGAAAISTLIARALTDPTIATTGPTPTST